MRARLARQRSRPQKMLSIDSERGPILVQKYVLIRLKVQAAGLDRPILAF